MRAKPCLEFVERLSSVCLVNALIDALGERTEWQPSPSCSVEQRKRRPVGIDLE